ncbi:MAG: hypothetical protein M0R80_09805 [Proteobacteria bacterium]|jgi:hypothetical protein|nr:hypothetical protein [Pseudomonadota bacterium]
MIDIYCRTEVKDFAILMEDKLRKNDFKGGWKQDDITTLLLKLQVNVEKLFNDAVMSRSSTDITQMKSIDDCADIANYAMMIVDNIKDELW